MRPHASSSADAAISSNISNRRGSARAFAMRWKRFASMPIIIGPTYLATSSIDYDYDYEIWTVLTAYWNPCIGECNSICGSARRGDRLRFAVGAGANLKAGTTIGALSGHGRWAITGRVQDCL